MQTSRMSLLRHAHFGRWEHKLIGADTPLLSCRALIMMYTAGWVLFICMITDALMTLVIRVFSFWNEKEKGQSFDCPFS